jgi:hypothetical protein
MRLAVYTNEEIKNGGANFAILIPTGALSFEATIAKDIPSNSPYKVVDLDDSAQKQEFDKIINNNISNVDYTFAWNGNFDDPSSPIQFTIDLERAKQYHLGYIRTSRDLEIKTLDIEYSKADETGNVALKTEIAAKKQKLRDMPADPRLVNCSDFEVLKTLTYEFLRDN